MTGREVTQEQFENLVDDVGYLQDEAEALKYVIDQVPHSETPPDGRSIKTMLRYLDLLQVNYFRPAVENAFSSNRTVTLKSLSSFDDSFDETDEELNDIFKILNKIIKHRAALLNVISKIPLIDWERILKDSANNEISLYDFANEMVKKERSILKEIADLVLIHQNEKLNRREIDSRAKQRRSE